MLFQRLQRDNCRHELHAIIGGQAKALAERFLFTAIAQNRAVTARPWVAQTGTVGENFYLLEHLW